MTLEFDHDIKNKVETLDIDDINYRYNSEEKMMHAITHGNYDAYLEVMNFSDAPDGFDVRVKNDSNHLRNRKNGLTTRKTLFRVAARRGGVPPIYLHIIATQYSTLIEQATSAVYLDEVLSNEMARSFCDAVREYSIKGYSATIQSAIGYIDSHLTQQLSVNKVAEALHFHPSYLSRKFKQETNRNLTDYVNSQRIEYAKSLFRTGKTNVTYVALSCGYSSSSYFSKVFKAYTGTFPTDYIKEVEENPF